MSRKYSRVLTGMILAFLVCLNSKALEKQEEKLFLKPSHAHTLSTLMMDLKIPDSVSQDVYNQVYDHVDDIVTLFEKNTPSPPGPYSSAKQALESLKGMKAEDVVKLMIERLVRIKGEIGSLLLKEEGAIGHKRPHLAPDSSSPQPDADKSKKAKVAIENPPAPSLLPFSSLAPDISGNSSTKPEKEPESLRKELKYEPLIEGSELAGYPFSIFDGTKTDENKDIYDDLVANSRWHRSRILKWDDDNVNERIVCIHAQNVADEYRESTVIWYPAQKGLKRGFWSMRLGIENCYLFNNTLFCINSYEPNRPINILSSIDFLENEKEIMDAFKGAHERVHPKEVRLKYQPLIRDAGFTGYPFILFDGAKNDENKDYYNELSDFTNSSLYGPNCTILEWGRLAEGKKKTVCIRVQNLADECRVSTVIWYPTNVELEDYQLRLELFSKKIFLFNNTLFAIDGVSPYRPINILSSSDFSDNEEEIVKAFRAAHQRVYPEVPLI